MSKTPVRKKAKLQDSRGDQMSAKVADGAEVVTLEMMDTTDLQALGTIFSSYAQANLSDWVKAYGTTVVTQLFGNVLAVHFPDHVQIKLAPERRDLSSDTGGSAQGVEATNAPSNVPASKAVLNSSQSAPSSPHTTLKSGPALKTTTEHALSTPPRSTTSFSQLGSSPIPYTTRPPIHLTAATRSPARLASATKSSAVQSTPGSAAYQAKGDSGDDGHNVQGA